MINQSQQPHLSGIHWSLWSTLFLSGGQLLLLFLMSRHLTQRDFGLLALAQMINGAAFQLIDGGLSAAIVADHALTKRQLQSIWYLNNGIGLLIALFVCATAIWWADFFQELRFTSIAALIAINIIFLSMSALPRALLRRDFQFRYLALVETGCFLSGAALTTWLMFDGWGVYAYFFGLILGSGLCALAFIVKSGRHFDFFGPADLSILRQKSSFGLLQLADRMISLLHTRADNFLIGAYAGTEALGAYDIAKQLTGRISAFMSAGLGPVLLSLQSQFRYNETQRRLWYFRVVHWSALISFPVYLTIIVLAEPLCAFLLGSAWIDQAYLLQLSAVYFLIRSSGMFALIPSLAAENPKISFRWNIVHGLTGALAVYLGLRGAGTHGAILAQIVLQTVFIVPVWHWLIRPWTGGSTWEYLSNFLAPFMGALVASGCAWGINNIAVEWTSWIAVALSIFLAIVIFILFQYLFNSIKWREFILFLFG